MMSTFELIRLLTRRKPQADAVLCLSANERFAYSLLRTRH